MTRLNFQPVRVSLGEDDEGRLVFAGDALVAVLVRLSALHGEAEGSWFLEGAFGLEGDGIEHPLFADLRAAEAWILSRLPAPAGVGPT